MRIAHVFLAAGLVLAACSAEREPSGESVRPEALGLAIVRTDGQVVTIDRLDSLQVVLDHFDGRAVSIEFAPGRHEVSQPISLHSNTRLSGAGQGVTVLEAIGALDAIVTTAGEDALTSITIEGFSVDCGGRARHGVLIRKTSELTLSRVTATGCLETGVRVSGQGTPTRGAVLSDLTLERNQGVGLMVLWASRNVRYTNIFAYANRGTGVVFDHSEGTAVNIIADQNHGDGVFFRNFFAFSATNITATRNGRNGIVARGLVSSTGQGWIAMGNSTSAPGRFDEIRFTAEDDLSYGVTRNAVLSGVIVGAYADGTGPATAADGLVIEPGVGPLEVSGLVTLDLAGLRTTAP